MNLTINCALCDMRKLTQEVLDAYSVITVNCASVISSPATQSLLAGHPVVMNAGNILSIPEDWEVITRNGSVTIDGSAIPKAPVFLQVNGTLILRPEAAPVLAQYRHIDVNGLVLCPDCLAGIMSRISVNGRSEIYPKDAVLLDRRFQLDQIFALRAKPGTYFLPNMLVAMDSRVDLKQLRAKGVTILTDRVLTTQSMVEDLLPLVPDSAAVTVVPDGTRYLADDLTLDALAVKKYGPRLYVSGNVRIPAPGAEALRQMKYLYINGDLAAPEALADLILDSGVCYDELHLEPDFSGLWIRDRADVLVDAALLRGHPEGIRITDCASVTLTEDVTTDQLEPLSIADCGMVSCSEALQAVLALHCQDVGRIGPAREDPSQNAVINTAKYVF